MKNEAVGATVRGAVAEFSTREILHVIAVTNGELEAHMASGAPSTQAHAGQLELLAACVAERDARGAAVVAAAMVPWVETNTEDGRRYGVSVRVF